MKEVHGRGNREATIQAYLPCPRPHRSWSGLFAIRRRTYRTWTASVENGEMPGALADDESIAVLLDELVQRG